MYVKLLILSTVLSSAFAACNDTAYATVSGNITAGGLVSSFASGVVVANGSSVSLSCNNATNDYLTPDTAGTGVYMLKCSGNAFTPPSPWPVCVRKCQRPSPPSGYSALQNATGGPVTVGTVLSFSCANNSYASGTTPPVSIYNLTCGATGTFSLSWPPCVFMCMAPTAAANYSDVNGNAGQYFSVGASVSYQCAGAGQLVAGTASNSYSMTCQSNGTFNAAAVWPSCAVRCAVPTGPAGLTIQSPPPSVDVGVNVTYTCATQGQTVGTTLSNQLTVTCLPNGTFPTNWPSCAVMCPVPAPAPGYSPINTTVPVGVGAILQFSCNTTGAKVGDTYSSQYSVTCGSSGKFPSVWPNCSVRCNPPRGEPGYNSQPAGTPTLSVGAVLTYTCIDPTALSGNTSTSNAFSVTCGADGQFPSNWPVCQTRCIIPFAESGYMLSGGNSNITTVAVGAVVSFKCQDGNATVGNTMSKYYNVTCGSDGRFPSGWPLCAAPATCPSPPPDPNSANTSLVLAPGTAAVITSYQTVQYVCNNSAQVTNEGKSVSLACLVTGAYATRTTPWPTCHDAAVCNVTAPIPPATSGLANSTSVVAKEADLAVYSCSNASWTANGMSTFSLPCLSDCTFGASIAWPVCQGPSPPPAAPATAVCHCLGELTNATQSTALRNQLCRNLTSSLVVTSTAETPPSRVRCGTTDLNNMTPENACFCDSPQQQSQTAFWFSLLLKMEPWEWTEDDQGNSYLQNASSTDYQNLKLQVEKSLDDAISASALGASSMGYVGTSVYRFISGPAAPLGLFPSAKPTTTPPATTAAAANTTAAAAATSTGSAAAAGNTTSTAAPVSGNTTSTSTSTTKTTTTTTTTKTTTTVAAGKRKRRQASGYTYIQVDLSTQFLNAGQPTQASFQALLDSFGKGNSTNGTLGTIVIDPNCDPTICAIDNSPAVCSNTFFSNLPAGYNALTPYGYYVPPYAPSLVDAGNQLQIGEIAELSCSSTNPLQYPRVDNADQDPNDHKLTVFCIPPQTPGQQFGTWSLSVVPDCASVCSGYLPDAPANSDLQLAGVLPLNQTQMINATMFNQSDSFLLSGDALIYECQTVLWGVYGGNDTTDDEFSCTAAGVLNVPDPNQPWPTCSPQTDMVMMAVELMLDKSDQTLTDRYKLIAYKQADFDKSIVDLPDHFLGVTIPVLCSLLICIAICCCCTRDGSPACRLCRSKVA